MSESLIEIDSALVASDTQEVKVALESEAPLIESSSKRRLEDDDLQLDGDIEDEDAVRSSNKKFCAENDTLTAGNDQDNFEVNDTDPSAIVTIGTEESDPLEVNEADEEQEELVEIPSSQELPESQRASDPEPEENVNKAMLEEEEDDQCADDADEHENDNEEDYDEEIEDEEDFESDSDDEQMMSRVMQNSENVKMVARPAFHTTNDEPIELDDSDDDDDAPTQQTYQPRIKTEAEDVEEEEEFPTENNVLEESEPESEPEFEESEEEEDMITELRRNHVNKKKSHTIELKEKLVKRSVKRFRVKPFRYAQGNTQNEQQDEVKSTKIAEHEIHESEKAEIIVEEKNGETHEEPMEVTEEETPEKKLPIEKEDVTIKNSSNIAEDAAKKETSPALVEMPKTNADSVRNEMVNGKSASQKSPVAQATEEALSLLDEIEKSSVDDVFMRHASKYTERTASLDEFSEELFNCLQLNKVAIDKATREWNAKLHMKFKIRQLMERVRRHRAVMEIETFGYKPELNVNNIHPIISSKSSTTTNSEGENFDKNLRLSNESVNRLIQDVRASIIKRDEQQRQRVEDSAILSESAFDNNSWSSLQMGSTSQGRQGQIVDVQSIINDFRSRNPQEIPRRGRRVKSLNHSYFDGTNPNHDELQNDRSDFSNFGGDFTSRPNRSSDQFPEVSLHPVHQNLYHKNNLTVPGEMNYGGGTQKSSLLQSILTKSTKSPIGFQASTPTTSTLARLLTAPERSLQSSRATPKQNFSQSNSRQSTSKVHNGEITITPINRSKDFAMDDEDNSMEPPLVIDENFDGRSFEDKKSTELLCQGCKKNKAFFMCAGCSRQWYCSKECQESAWDGHSLYCSI